MPDKNYRYGSRCRKQDHHIDDGQNIRTSAGQCWACNRGKPPGLFTHNITSPIDEYTPRKRKYASKEEWMPVQVQRVMKWAKENPEKTKVYRERYDNKPETIARRKDAYKNRTPEQDARMKATQKRYLERKKLKLKEQHDTISQTCQSNTSS